MAAEFFPCLFRLDHVDHYVIWYSGDRDGLVRENGRIVEFVSLVGLRAYAQQHSSALGGKVAEYDWDSIAQWCDAPTAIGIAPGPFLDAWNMIVDTLPPHSGSGLFSHVDDKNSALYQKLFRANNLSAMTPRGEEYYPVWTQAEDGGTCSDTATRNRRSSTSTARRRVPCTVNSAFPGLPRSNERPR